MTAGRTERDRPLVDVRDMIVVHTAVLREFRLAPAAVRRTAAGDQRRVRMVGGHLTMIFDLLHHHHHGEDELLWPVMQQRLDPDALRMIAAVEAQHEGIDAALDEAARLRAVWVRTADVADRDRLADCLVRLHALLATHLDLEERALLPLAAAVLTEPEWRAVGEAGARSVPPWQLPLVVGMFAYEGDPAVLADMLRDAPPPIRVLVPRIGPLLYGRRARRVHGTARP